MKTSTIFERMILLVMLMALVALAGCSDEQKSDAARMEQELLEGKSDTSSETSDTTTADSLLAAQPDVAAVPMEEVEPEPEIGSGYALQVASCSDQAYGEYLVDKYISRGYTSYLTTFDYEGMTYFRVRLGPYETAEEAQTVKAEIIDKYSVEGWLVLQ